jgi:hypothetical protein
MNKACTPLRRLLVGASLAVLWCGPLRAVAQSVPHATLPECQAGDPDLLLPDIVPDPPRDLREIYSGVRRYLQFTTAVGNIGDGPLVLEGRTVSGPNGLVTQAYQRIWRSDGSQCARPAGQFEFHERHRHWHFENFVAYELRADDPYTGPLVAGGSKTSFCLLDLENVRGFHPSRYPRQLGLLTCKSPEDIQGISVGWKDVYQRILPGQSINLDPDPQHQVPTGTYYLSFVADPDHLLWEKDTSNNNSSTAVGVGLPPLTLGGPVVEPPTEQRPPVLRPPPLRPTRIPRPTRPPRAPRPARPGRATPTPPPPPPATPTPTAIVNGPAPTDCDNACEYPVSQLRMTWYDALGLHISALIGTGSCPPLHPKSGDSGTIQMVDWLTQRRTDTGLEHQTTFVLDNGTNGSTANGGGVTFASSGSAVTFAYTAPVRALATASSGADFPVVFQMCLTVGDQAVKARLVCQPKNTGMLCHK